MTHSSSKNPLRQRLGGLNIYLVGMMGCGKSTTGPLISKYLAYGFVDIDKVIEELQGKTISKIFEEEGEEIFRQIESEVLKEIGARHSLVVATGGGVVMSPINWGVLHQGLVIWLDPGRERILSRLKSDTSNRPLLQGKDSLQAFDEILIHREKHYSEADLHLLIGDEAPERVAKKIISSIPSVLRNPEDLNGRRTIAD